MALFESYLEPKKGYRKAITWSTAVSITLLVVVTLSMVAYPLIRIRAVPVPESIIGIFEAAPPPPPPPPPPAGGAPEKPKEEKKKKPKEPDVIKEVEKVEKEIKKDDGPAPGPPGVEGGVEGGVAGGVQGGVVGGTVGGAAAPPGKMISQPQKKISGDDPTYPAAARAQGIAATIVARVCISEIGAVASIKILKGEPGFNESVQGAVKGWRYEPYMANGVAVPACFPVYFNFNLKK